MNLKRLEHLIAVAEEGSLAAAARRVHLSQPALTRSLQALESEAGMVLCNRSARGVTLTPAGRLVTDRARRILFETHCLERELALLRQHGTGVVRFGMGPYPAALLLSQVLCTMRHELPQLQLQAEVSGATTLLEEVLAEKLDFAVVARQVIRLAPELLVHDLPPEISGFFVRPGHHLLDRSITLKQLRAASLAAVLLPGYAHENLCRLLRCKPGERLPFQVESNDFHVLTDLACRSDTVLLAPTRALQAELEAGRLIQLTGPEVPVMSTQFSVVHLAQRILSPAAERSIAAIEAAAS